MKCSEFEPEVDVLPRWRRCSAVAATVLLLALAAPAMNAARSPYRQAPQKPAQPLALAGGAARPSSDAPASKGVGPRPRALRLSALPGQYVDVVVTCEQSYAELAKSLAGGIDRITSRLHCEQAQFSERLRASGLKLPHAGSTVDDGCAL